jgi:uncharacterized protein
VTRLGLIRRRLGIVPAAMLFPSPQERPMSSTTADVPTESGSRYLQQLCKHWAHTLHVEFTPTHGVITFPKDARGADYPGNATATLDAGAAALTVRIDASSPEQRDALKGVVARHLDRFAFREAPLAFDWHDA